jgi:hypothetical protein
MDPAGDAAVWMSLEILGRRMGFGELSFYDLDVAPSVGAFAFDYSPPGDHGYGQYVAWRPYRIVGTPRYPVTAAQLSSEAQAFLADVRFSDLCFAEVESLIVEETFDSIHRPTAWDRWDDPSKLRPVADRPAPPPDDESGGA